MDERLIYHAINQAKTFLNEFEEFYPFASILNAESSIQPYFLYMDGDIDMEEYSSQLKKCLQSDLDSGAIMSYAMATNVRAKLNDIDDVMDAIEIQLSNNGNNLFYYMPYEIKENGIFFHPLIKY